MIRIINPRDRYIAAERLLENAEKLNLSQNELRHIKGYYLNDIIDPAIKLGVEMQPEFIINNPRGRASRYSLRIKFKNYGL